MVSSSQFKVFRQKVWLLMERFRRRTTCISSLSLVTLNFEEVSTNSDNLGSDPGQGTNYASADQECHVIRHRLALAF